MNERGEVFVPIPGRLPRVPPGLQGALREAAGSSNIRSGVGSGGGSGGSAGSMASMGAGGRGAGGGGSGLVVVDVFGNL